MPTFSYTSGNPSNLTAGGNASMADIQGPLVDLRDFVNGGLDTANLTASAGITATQLAAGATGLARGCFRARCTAAPAAFTSGFIPFQTEDWDASGWYDTATGRYTPLLPGYYRLSAQAQFGPNTAGNYVRVGIYKNGALFCFISHLQWGGATQALVPSGSTLVQANGTTDFFQVNWDSNVSIQPGAGADTHFCGELVGRL